MQEKVPRVGQKGGTTRHSLNRLIETVEAPLGFTYTLSYALERDSVL